jgi:hypothetical protein
MKQTGVGFWIVFAIEFILTIICWYMAVMSYNQESASSAWFFLAFSMLFAIPLFFNARRLVTMNNPELQAVDDKTRDESIYKPARFVPHWFMSLAITILVIIILSVIVSAIFSALK